MKPSGRVGAARKDYAVEIMHDNASHAAAVSEKIWSHPSGARRRDSNLSSLLPVLLTFSNILRSERHVRYVIHGGLH